MSTVEMSLDQVLDLIKRSVLVGKYDNARAILEDIIKALEQREKAATSKE